ncbi:MAG: DUF4160 domain-containing protein, partial [Candidatus Riflebacteria bacterium]|nr:DUF4160 domain-containing protein [Candidatus Riflebacteria bacterium]
MLCQQYGSIRGIQIFINWREHLPPHFHAKYAG